MTRAEKLRHLVRPGQDTVESTRRAILEIADWMDAVEDRLDALKKEQARTVDEEIPDGAVLTGKIP